MPEPEYKKVEHTLTVPKNTGVAGFMRTVESLIRLPRVQAIHIEASGKVTWSRYVVGDEEDELPGIDFGALEPWAVIRNKEVVELPVHTSNAALVLSMMLDRATSEGLRPITFVSGANSVFREWFADTTGYHLGSTSVMGLPLHGDRHISDTALLLCAAYASDAPLAETQKAYKVEMDYVAVPGTFVEVFGNE